MPEIEFTINTDTGEMEMKIEGVKGSSCSDVAKIATELLGAPAKEVKTQEYFVQPKSTPLIQNKKRN